MRHKFSIVTVSKYGQGKYHIESLLQELARAVEAELGKISPRDELVDVQVGEIMKISNDNSTLISVYIRWIENCDSRL